MPLIIVTRSELSVDSHYSEGRYVIAYQLPESLLFEEPHYARLVYASGVNNSCLLFADFVQLQVVDGSLQPYLGCTAIGAERSWVPLASNNLPSFGYFTVERLDRTKLPRAFSYRLIVEIASASELEANGAKGKAYF